MKLTFEKMFRNTPEFIEFVNNFEEQFAINLEKNNAKLLDFHIGYYYFSGYFEIEGALYYFGWHNGEQDLLYRRTYDITDFSGQSNHFIKIQKGLVNELCKILKKQ